MFILFYIILNLVIFILSIVFYIIKKKESDSLKLKIIIFLFIIISIACYIVPSFTNFGYSSHLVKSSSDIILINFLFFLLCFSTTLFFYSLNSRNEDVIYLDTPSFFVSRKGKIKLGKSMKGEKKKFNFFLSLKDLEKHMFVCGATGTGKSNFIQNLLINFTQRYKIPFFLVEFKGEYHFLQNTINNLLIIRPGENFSLNIFNPEGAIPEVHAERIFDILKSGQFLDDSSEFSPQMQKVLVEILTKICKNKDLQNWKGFYEYCKVYAKEYARDIPMLSQTLISIKNRIRRFSLGSLKAIFDTEHKVRIKELFERNILIDLSSIIRLGGEKADALFFLNMILKYLWDKNITRGAYKFKGIKHITIVEDAQYFVPKDLVKKTKLSTYLEDIAMLQRGTGECLISIATHPGISEEILANCGALVVFKTHMQREFLCELLNLNVEYQDYLSILDEGQCIVRVNSIKRPFLLSIPLIEREYPKISEINSKNELVLNGQEQQNERELIKKLEMMLIALKLIKKKIKSFCLRFIKILKEIKIKLLEMKKKEEVNKIFKDNFIVREEIEYQNGYEYYMKNNEKSEQKLDDDIDEEDDEDFEELKKYVEILYKKQINKD